MSKILQTMSLSKTYSGGVKAVDGVTFDIGKHKEILGLLGANGAGKSSTFNMATMQIKRTSGDLYLFGEEIRHIDSLKSVSITA